MGSWPSCPHAYSPSASSQPSRSGKSSLRLLAVQKQSVTGPQVDAFAPERPPGALVVEVGAPLGAPSSAEEQPCWATLVHLGTWQIWYSLSLSPPCPHYFPLPHTHSPSHPGGDSAPGPLHGLCLLTGTLFSSLTACMAPSLPLWGFAEVSGHSRSPYFKLYTHTPEPLFLHKTSTS